MILSHLFGLRQDFARIHDITLSSENCNLHHLAGYPYVQETRSYTSVGAIQELDAPGIHESQ